MEFGEVIVAPNGSRYRTVRLPPGSEIWEGARVITTLEMPDGSKYVTVHLPRDERPKAEPKVKTIFFKAGPRVKTVFFTMKEVKDRYYQEFVTCFNLCNRPTVVLGHLPDDVVHNVFRSWAIKCGWYGYKYNYSIFTHVLRAQFLFWWYFMYTYRNGNNIIEDILDRFIQFALMGEDYDEPDRYRPSFGDPYVPTAEEAAGERSEFFKYWNANKKYLYPKAAVNRLGDGGSWMVI